MNSDSAGLCSLNIVTSATAIDTRSWCPTVHAIRVLLHRRQSDVNRSLVFAIINERFSLAIANRWHVSSQHQKFVGGPKMAIKYIAYKM